MNKIVDQNGKGLLQEAVCIGNRCKCDCYDCFENRIAALPRDAKGFIPQLIAPPGVGRYRTYWREDWKKINPLECRKWEEQNDEIERCYSKEGNENE